MDWTKDQQTIIDRRTGTLLVSAAAGSGKTAVLVQRILEWIVRDRKNIDEFLVVTFTKAAAGQMKSKIRKALEDLQEQYPGDEHIIRQLSLIHRANIMTIDSFCKSIFNEHFHLLKLDPSMRIMDEPEGVLMQEDVLERVLEQAYEKQAEAMQELHGYMNDVRSNAAIVELIKSIHNQAVSFPYPMVWYENALQDAQAVTEETVNQTAWMQLLLQEIQSLLADAADIPMQVYREYQSIGAEYNPKNYEKYAAYFYEECNLVDQVMKAEGYAEMQRALSDTERSVSRFSWKNTKVPEDHAIAEAWQTYAEVKKEAKKYVKAPLSEMLAHQQNVSPVLQTILTLGRTFTQEYTLEKQKKNCMDFPDVEHYALQILTDEQEDGSHAPSEAAMQLRDSYVEIMIDEYQDSNDLQEAILTSIAKRTEHELCNMFMVGDIKQSIYKFRMARPILFQTKYESFDGDLVTEGAQKKVELRQNFRSREEVLNSVNLLFYQIMRKSLGGIDYNPAVALCPGRDFPKIPSGGAWYGSDQGRVNLRTEILLVDAVTDWNSLEGKPLKSDISEKGKPQEPDISGIDVDHEEEDSVEEMTLEARVIAQKILELCDREHPFPIWDDKNQRYRPCTYRDIVILLRTGKTITEEYRQVLMEAGIPVYAESGKGYFDSVEVKNILNMLSVIDNARDDIALTGVLRGPMVGLKEEQLAKIRCESRDRSMWDAIQIYSSYGNDGAIVTVDREILQKLRQFLAHLSVWKEKKTYCTIRELILDILHETGYYIYLSAMPHGNIRQANIHKLIEKATAYETTSYRGLFDFLRYIERVRTADQDFGEASVLGANDDLVQIMTIHKSKGLEFPVVILGGCGKQFNEMDTRKPVFVDADAYLAVNDMNLRRHYYERTEKRECLKRHVIEENLAEEMRILYVAMTRAQEKLVLVGSVKSRLAKKEEYQMIGSRYYMQEQSSENPTAYDNTRNVGKISKAKLLKCKSYLAWLVEGICHMQNHNINMDCMEYRIITPDMLDWQVEAEIERSYQASVVWQERVQYSSTEEDEQELRRRFGWRYDHMDAATRKGKLSVSEIKKMSQIVDDMEMEVDEIESVRPENIADMRDRVDRNRPVPKEDRMMNNLRSKGGRKGSLTEKVSEGAAYGTLVHLVMEKIAFTKIACTGDVQQELENMVQLGILTEEEKEIVPAEKIYKMLTSSLGQRMTEADRQGRLYKERQFVIGMPMKEVYPDTDEEDLELIQGIIDAYFEEDGDYVLMDYKTDRVSEEQGAEELIHKYHAQLEYYKRTLEQLTGKTVKEVYIYSFALDKVISL